MSPLEQIFAIPVVHLRINRLRSISTGGTLVVAPFDDRDADARVKEA